MTKKLKLTKPKEVPERKTEEIRAFKLVTGECIIGVAISHKMKRNELLYVIMGHDTRAFKLVRQPGKNKDGSQKHQIVFGPFVPLNTYPIPIHAHHIISEIPPLNDSLMRGFCEATGRTFIGVPTVIDAQKKSEAP